MLFHFMIRINDIINVIIVAFNIVIIIAIANVMSNYEQLLIPSPVQPLNTPRINMVGVRDKNTYLGAYNGGALKMHDNFMK